MVPQILLVAAGLLYICGQACTHSALIQSHMSSFLSNTHMKERACLCVSPSRVVEPCYSTCVFFCSDAAMLPQFSHAQPPKLHADPHRLPAGSLRHGENNGERRKRATVEIERETRQEVKPGQAESRVTKKKNVKGLVEETDERLSHGVKKRPLRWSSVEEEAR